MEMLQAENIIKTFMLNGSAVPVLMTVHPAPTADFFFLFPSGDI